MEKVIHKYLTAVTVSVALAFLLLSCTRTRTKNCEYGRTGYFIYLSNPQINNNNVTIRAYFVPEQPNLNIDSLSVVLTNPTDGFIRNLVYQIRGHIPSVFTEEPDIPIPVICELDPCQYTNNFRTQPTKIICIEKM